MSKRQTLDRLLSKLGIASRGVSADWIRAGKVRVNGKIVRNPETWLNWPDDSVIVDGKEVEQAPGRFFIFHKPTGYITTHSDEKGRKTVFDLLPEEFGFIHAVGRLDKSTSGLLLLTNDSHVSSFLTDPTNKIPRRYLVTVWGEITEEKIQRAKKGLVDEGELLQCSDAVITKITKHESHLDATLLQGKNREVRRLFKALGHEVTGLHRLQYGPFLLQDLKVGAWREIAIKEVRDLLR